MSACRYCGNAAPDGADVCLNCRAVLENASDSQQAAINELALLSAGLKESSVSDRTKDERSGSSGTESSGKQSSAPELCAVPGGKSGISASYRKKHSEKEILKVGCKENKKQEFSRVRSYVPSKKLCWKRWSAGL